jgi:hypothetical protein
MTTTKAKGKRSRPKTELGIPDLEHSKVAALRSLGSPDSVRGYQHAIDEFVAWYCSEPPLIKRTGFRSWSARPHHDSVKQGSSCIGIIQQLGPDRLLAVGVILARLLDRGADKDSTFAKARRRRASAGRRRRTIPRPRSPRWSVYLGSQPRWAARRRMSMPRLRLAAYHTAGSAEEYNSRWMTLTTTCEITRCPDGNQTELATMTAPKLG